VICFHSLYFYIKPADSCFFSFYSASTQKMSIQNLRKSVAKLSIIGIMSTSWGAGICARDWRGAERLRKRRNPRKARFFAKQKMRPNEVLKNLLHLLILFG
jgi:hypothetical protein